jgi:hypothetical protein
MMFEKEFNRYRRAARGFFQSLEQHLNGRLRSPEIVRGQVKKVRRRASAHQEERWTSEGTFLCEYIIPEVHEFVAAWRGMGRKMAFDAFLVEGFRSWPKIASGTPARFANLPFPKTFTSMSEIMARWKKGGSGVIAKGGRD